MVNTTFPWQSSFSIPIQQRINQLIDRYLPFDHLNDRLAELPLQFANPKPRPWKAIDWQDINTSQIVGMELQVFLAILQGAIDTEAPIRDYTQTSRQYLQPLHPQLARFVGGTIENGTLTEIGLWEKEERQHTPALSKIYTHLTGEKPTPVPHDVRAYQAPEDPYTALYRHGVHRVATEYGATCLYLWLMAHTTGTLHVIFEELLLDEVNHMTKFWGFGVWAFPKASALTLVQTLLKSQKTYHKERGSLWGTLDRMTRVLGWQAWSWQNRLSFMWTCTRSLFHLWRWSRSLKPAELTQLFGPNSFTR